jgi:hypothetical protein
LIAKTAMGNTRGDRAPTTLAWQTETSGLAAIAQH